MNKVLNLSNKNLTRKEESEIYELINQPLYDSIILSNNEIENINIY
jgi:hypothetical protein